MSDVTAFRAEWLCLLSGTEVVITEHLTAPEVGSWNQHYRPIALRRKCPHNALVNHGQIGAVGSHNRGALPAGWRYQPLIRRIRLVSIHKLLHWT